MDIQKMHYEIDQGLQKNASFVYSNFEPEEIDNFINKMVERFIKDRWDQTDRGELGFEANQKRLEDIQALIVPYTKEFLQVCTPLNVREVLYTEGEGTPGEWTVTGTGDVTVTDPFTPITGTNSITVKANRSDRDVVFTNPTAMNLSAIETLDLHFNSSGGHQANPGIKIIARNSISGDESVIDINDGDYGFDFYSGNTGSVSVPGSAFPPMGTGFNQIILSFNADFGNAQVDDVVIGLGLSEDPNCEDGALLLSAGENATLQLSEFDPEYMFLVSGIANVAYDPCKRKLDEASDYELPMRVLKQNELSRAKRDPYRKSSPENGGIMNIFNNTIQLHGSKRFIYKSVTIDYIRKPAEVSLALSIDCDLAEHTHDEIVDLTVQHILEVIESPRYQSNSAQTQKTE